MITLVVLSLALVVFLTGCKKDAGEAVPAQPVSADTLIKLEAASSKMSEEKGFHTALKAYMANDATKLIDAHFPLIGGDSIVSILDSSPDTGFVMTWAARDADISSSGDLGYTWGDWVFRPKHPKGGDTLYGNYYTIWKKQSDGSWKWVLDGGNTTPKP